VRNGPQGGDVGDTEAVGRVIASIDQVAVDSYGCGLVGQKPADLRYLALAAARGLGAADLGRVALREIS